MSKDNIVALTSPEGVEDPQAELLRTGAWFCGFQKRSWEPVSCKAF